MILSNYFVAYVMGQPYFTCVNYINCCHFLGIRACHVSNKEGSEVRWIRRVQGNPPTLDSQYPNIQYIHTNDAWGLT